MSTRQGGRSPAAAAAGSTPWRVLLSGQGPRTSHTQRCRHAGPAGLLVGSLASSLGASSLGGSIAAFLAAALTSGNRTGLRWRGRAGRTLPMLAMAALVLAVPPAATHSKQLDEVLESCLGLNPFDFAAVAS